MSTEDRLHRMMSTVGQNDVDQSSWADFLTVAHRSHRTHRALAAVVVIGAVAAAGFGTGALIDRRADRDVPPSDRNVAPVPIPEDVPSQCPTAPEFAEGALGTVAYLGATELHVVDVATGEDSILVQGGPGFGEGFFAGDVKISPDGQWVSFGEGLMVPTAGGDVCAPLGEDTRNLEWAPDGGAVALSSEGSIRTGGPREMAGDHSYGGYRFDSLALSPDGESIAVSAVPSDPPGNEDGGLWVIERDTLVGTPQAGVEPEVRFDELSHEEDMQGIEIAGWDPIGGWVLFWTSYGKDAASLNAEGGPLWALEIDRSEVVPITDAMISERDQMTWCGDRLLFTDGAGRLMQDKKIIAGAQPPSWEKEVIAEDQASSLSDPACDKAGSGLIAISTTTGGDRGPALYGWSAGTDLTGMFGSAFAILHPTLSHDGRVAVVEVQPDRTGQANELLRVRGEETSALGILGGQSSYPMVGGSPTWDWHRP